MAALWGLQKLPFAPDLFRSFEIVSLIVQAEKVPVEARTIPGWVGSADIKRLGTGLRMTCPKK
jgi:hypothetical protein